MNIAPPAKHLVLSLFAVMIMQVTTYAHSQAWKEVGRNATADEVKAWDIDVRGDFKGLPQGSGTVQRGEEVWEGKCASCHGTFGESNSVFTPIVGGTTAEDIKTGRVAALATGDVAQRTTLMKLSKVSTLWDYINRAMPWNAPKTLTVEEVYSVTAYILNMGDIVPSDFTLSDKNIAEVQKKLPNRNGMVLHEDMWKANGKGDVQNVACMKDCPTEAKISSFLPDFARDAHGDLAKQNRLVGGTRGVKIETGKGGEDGNDKGAEKTDSMPKVAAASTNQSEAKNTGSNVKAHELVKANGCTACHGLTNKIVGPGFNEIANKYKGKADSEAYLTGKIKNGGAGVWGPIPMPPQPNVKENDVKEIAKWLISGAN